MSSVVRPKLPAQALAPLHERLAALRGEIAAEADLSTRQRKQTAARELEALLKNLETGHAPTGP